MSRQPAGAGVAPPLPGGVAGVREPRADGALPLYRLPAWVERFPWLVQATTGIGDPDDPYDLGLFRDAPVGAVLGRWRELRRALEIPAAVHTLQVHGAEVRSHDTAPPGLLILEGFDGHLTRRPGLLLTVSVADCVPIFLVDPDTRRIALLHGGWRGTAAGILRRGLARLRDGDPAGVHVHLGPAICGRCYEVGPEVHEALGLEPPTGNAPVDVRAVLARQAIELGVPPEQVTVSEHCTRCGEGFFSHRGGSTGRQLGLLAIRA